jgi:hypothetical protein
MDLSAQNGFFVEDFIRYLNTVLPEGIQVTDALKLIIPSGAKKHAVPALLWGYVYIGLDGAETLVPAGNEKQYRQTQAGAENADKTGADSSCRIYGLRRKSVLAKTPQAPEKPESYFTVYKQLYLS